MVFSRRFRTIFEKKFAVNRRNTGRMLHVHGRSGFNSEKRAQRRHINQGIKISHKIKRRGSNSIIVKFTSHTVKKRLYIKKELNLKIINLKDLFPSYSSAARGGSTRIFINENLIILGRFLVGTVNKMKRDGMFLSVLTIDGKIFCHNLA